MLYYRSPPYINILSLQASEAMARKQEELQFLGFLNIFNESFKIIFSQPKIFTQITLLFILPVSAMAVALIIILEKSLLVTHFSKAFYGTDTVGSPAFNNDVPDATSSPAGYHALIFVAGVSFVFSLFSISTVVYTVACIYTGKEISFRKIIGVVPKVWKRLVWTQLCRFCIYLAAFAVFFLVVFLFMTISSSIMISVSSNHSSKSSLGGLVGISIGVILVSLLLVVAVIYIGIVWLLGDVVSVLENNCGMKALKKSKTLITGKMGTTIAIFLLLFFCSLLNQLFMKQQRDKNGRDGTRIIYEILSLILLTVVSLLTLVVKTVLYFVCKSYQHEPIDKFSLVDFTEDSLVDHLPLKTREEPVNDLQLQV